MPGGGTTQSGAFRFPYEFTDVAYEIRRKLEAMGLGQDWERLLDDFMALYMDRDRALEDYTTAAAGSILFATVAGDGTGDFTTIKAAIEDVGTHGAVATSSAVIFVKPYDNSGLGYDEDGLGEIATAANVNITVWAGTFGTQNRQIWSTDGFASTNLDSLGITLAGFTITLPALKALLNNTANWSGNVDVTIENCIITAASTTYGLMAPTRTGGNWYVNNSSVPWLKHGGTITNSGGAARSMVANFHNSTVILGSTAGTSILTHSSADSSLAEFVFDNCVISFANLSCAIEVHGSFSSGRNSNRWAMTNCAQSGVGSGFTNSMTFSRMNFHCDGFYVHHDAESSGPGLSIVLDSLNDGSSSNRMGTWTLTGLAHSGLNVTVTDDSLTSLVSPDIAPGQVNGHLLSLTLNCSSALVDVTVNQANANVAPITIGGDYNVVRAAVRYMSAAAGVGPALTVTGHDNRIELTAYNLTTPYEDFGYNNIINGGISGTPLTTSIVDAKGDLLVGLSDNEIRRLGVGTADQRLTADSAQELGIKWSNPTFFTFDANGDLLLGTGDNTYVRVPLGAANRVLRAQPSLVGGGVSWDYQRTLQNRLTANQASLETDTAGWTAETGCTIARNATQASHGTASLEITKT